MRRMGKAFASRTTLICSWRTKICVAFLFDITAQLCCQRTRREAGRSERHRSSRNYDHFLACPSSSTITWTHTVTQMCWNWMRPRRFWIACWMVKRGSCTMSFSKFIMWTFAPLGYHSCWRREGLIHLPVVNDSNRHTATHVLRIGF